MTVKDYQKSLSAIHKGINALIERNETRLKYERFTYDQQAFIKGKIYAWKYIKDLLVNTIIEETKERKVK